MITANALKETEYVGCYLLNLKPGQFVWFGSENSLTLVYKNVMINSSDLENPVEVPYYTYTVFGDLMLDEEGNVEVDLVNYSTPSNSYSFSVNERDFYVYGFETLDELFKTRVTANLDQYTYVSSMEN